MSPDEIYTDGGVIGPNPSRHGCTWTFLHVSAGQVLLKRSGIITPADLDIDEVTNNVSETIALVRALESIPADWSGVVFTDSMVARQRLLNPKLMGSLPVYLKKRVAVLQRRKLDIRLVAGHPTEQELKQGYANRNRFPVSIHNVACDRECTRLAKLFLEDCL